ncbi:hypothetical protein OHU11_30130 [Streptomyces sp. NBC_00257]|uniref:hypothetical protein n=1 Tax=unclassified Streptomyces TaxID=2593676 RepID=UPI00225AA3A9|nr:MULTISPECIES: hypothetical protein [unclassified Streptomyces]MCX5431912.1 hypothetical protein [Streptomyces sp. NBC_00062]
MSYQQIERMTPAASPSRVGQGTAVEQSRAVAEVQAAVLVARQFPRDEALAIAKMRTACAQQELAQRAFFRFPRGTSTVSGETIQLAKELARCWGNIQFGVAELRRDEEYGESEMQAWAWDMESNERSSTTFIVPHARWSKGKAEKLADFRDVYENNANNGARRLREMIFTVLPVWYIEQAKSACTKTLANGNGDVPRAQRIADCVAAFDGIGITADQIEAKLGRSSAKWTDIDLGQLQVIYQSIQRGEVTADEEFPAPRVTVEEITAPAAAPDIEQSGTWPATAQLGSAVRA